MSISNSVTNLAGGLSSLNTSKALEASNDTRSVGIGDFSSIIQQQLNKINSTNVLKKTYGDNPDSSNTPQELSAETLAAFAPIKHPSELDVFCETLNNLFKNKDVINYLGLEGTQLDQWDTYYRQYAQDKKDSASLVEASRSMIHQILQAKGPTQTVFDEIKSNLEKNGQELEKSKLGMLYSLNKILTPDQMASTIDLMEKTLNPNQATPIAETSI